MNIISNKETKEEKDGSVFLTQTVVTEYPVGHWEKDKKGRYLLHPHIRCLDEARQDEIAYETISKWKVREAINKCLTQDPHMSKEAVRVKLIVELGL